MRYPGGKNAAGIFQWLINQMPPHALYCEPFAGSAAVARLKRPATKTILIDLDPGAIAALHEAVPPRTELIEGDALAWLYLLLPQAAPDWFFYCDPPYLAGITQTKLRYKHVLSDAEHDVFLKLCCEAKCYVAISGYPSDLYSERLKGWRMETRQAITRGGSMATECLWMNFPLPTRLHDVSFRGGNFREREKYRRQLKRWVRRFAGMDEVQRQAIRQALDEADGEPLVDPVAVNGAVGRGETKR